MKAKCIYAGGYTGQLTLNKVYDILYYGKTETFVRFIGDSGKICRAFFSRFKVIPSFKLIKMI